MNKKFNFSVWSFATLVTGYLFAAVMGLAEGSNLWLPGAILGGLAGLIIGAISGVILKLIKVPMKYA
jgi:ribose/xylose/arabinose/galactoside ABC-type transport system permease subunit